MALETLRSTNSIGTEPVKHMEATGLQASLIMDGLKKMFTGTNIIINDKMNLIAFRLQNGPVKAVGKNGCQVSSLIDVAIEIIAGLDKRFPCEENKRTLEALQEALGWQNARTAKRVVAGVEGYNKPHE